MTIFEIIVTVAIIAIVMLLTTIGTFVKGVWENQKSQEKKLDIIAAQIANIWYVQDKVETNTAITASNTGKMYNNLCCITGKEEPRYNDEKIIQMSASNTATMLQNMADIRKEQESTKKGGQDENPHRYP